MPGSQFYSHSLTHRGTGLAGLVLAGPCRGPDPANVMSQGPSHVITMVTSHRMLSPDVSPRVLLSSADVTGLLTRCSRGHRCLSLTGPGWCSLPDDKNHTTEPRSTTLRNPLPSLHCTLYSGLYCTPVQHAWGPLVRVPWRRFHELKVCQDHI